MTTAPDKPRRKDYRCPQCNVIFSRWASQVHVKKPFCSMECRSRHLWTAGNLKPLRAEILSLECGQCGKAFERPARVERLRTGRRKGDKVFCSKKCFGLHNRPPKSWVKVKCETCKKDFEKPPSVAKLSKRHFCSNKCKNYRGDTAIRYNCPGCDKEVVRYKEQKSGVAYCSLMCKSKLEPPRRSVVNCKHCGAEVQKYKSEIDRGGGVFFCNKECEGEYKRAVYSKYQCVACGGVFRQLPSKVNMKNPACSKECASLLLMENPLVLCKCNGCGKDFFRKESAAWRKNRGANDYCSKACYCSYRAVPKEDMQEIMQDVGKMVGVHTPPDDDPFTRRLKQLANGEG